MGENFGLMGDGREEELQVSAISSCMLLHRSWGETAAPPRGSYLNLSFRLHQWLQNFPANCTRLLGCSRSLGGRLPVCPKWDGITTVHSVAHLQALNLNRNEELGGNQPIRFRAQALLVHRSSGAPRIGLAGSPSSCRPASPTSHPCLGFSAFQRVLLALSSPFLSTL